MQKFALDLDNPQNIDIENYTHNILDNRGIQDHSDSRSFRNNSPFRNDMMFNSPMRKALIIGQPTPGPLSCLGFTPYTPKEINYVHPDHSTAKTKLKIYEQLNFEDQQEHLYYNTTPSKKKSSSYQQNLQLIQETPAKGNNKKQVSLSLKRTQRKRKQTQLADFVKTQESKSHHGLRNLASSVKNIIARLGIASSKQIADALIKQLQQEKQIAPNSKQQQNIKRRVYDALKVLVSADVLIRDNDKRLIAKPILSKNTSITSVHSVLKQKVAAMRKTIEQKTHKAILMNQKWKAGQQLIQRNKNNYSPTNQKIFFPFVGMCIPQQNLAQIKTQIKQDKEITSININKGSIQIIGDIDIVLQLRIIQLRRFVEQNPQQLHD